MAAPPVGGPVSVKSKLVERPAGSVTLSAMIWPGTRMSTLKPVSHLHLEGAPGTACSGLVQRELSPGWRQLVQLGRSSFPLASASVHTTVSVTEGYSGL